MRQAKAWAKVNLALHVTGRRDDGYHLLDSLVAFGVAADTVTAQSGDGLTVTGPFAAGVPTDDSNLIRRALAAAGQTRAVTLDKTLPHPAGIGGGSSDAAAVLQLVDADLPVPDLLRLGADLPVCVAGRVSRMQGIGEILSPVAMPDLPAVLVNPGVPVPTGQVFAGMQSVDNPALDDLLNDGSINEWLSWLARQRNDMEAPAIRIAPVIGDALRAIVDTGAAVARMSGSGATCFGLFHTVDAAQKAAATLQRPDWWVRAGVLR